jgi:PKD repeat protein
MTFRARRAGDALGRARRNCGVALLAGLVIALGGFAYGTSDASASGPSDTEEIAALHSYFSVGASNATLTRVLDSKKLGGSIRADLACATNGEQALGDHEVVEAVMEGLSGVLSQALSEDPFAEALIAVAASRLPAAIDFLLQVHEQLASFQSLVPPFVKSLATLYSSPAYKELLVEYSSQREEGKSPEEVQELMRNELAPSLHAVEHARSLSEAQLFAQYEYTSGCMTFVQNGEDRAAYGAYIENLATGLHEYETDGGDTPGGLTVIPQPGGTAEVIDNGKALLDEVSLQDGSGDTLAVVDELGPGEAESVSLSSTPATAIFSVDGIEGVSRHYGDVAGELYVGEPFAEPVSGAPMSRRLTFDAGPFAATNLSPSYKWEFGDGTSSSEPSVTHAFECFGQNTAHFTAQAGKQTAARALSVVRPPPFAVGWSTEGDETAVAPNVALTFLPNSSIPSSWPVSWSFGDGQVSSERKASHAWSAPGNYNVTIKVSQPTAGCPPLTATEEVTIGRSDEWIVLSESIPTMKLSSAVAGYVIDGPTNLNKGHTLTIGPGVNVKFAPLGGEGGQLVLRGGELHVAGSAVTPAVFTSRYDDTAGGHCTCAPTGHVPEPGDWYGLTIVEGSASIEHASVRYAGHAIDLQGSGATVSVAASTLTHSGDGIFSSGANALAVTSSTLSDDSDGVDLSCFACAYSPTISHVTFSEDETGVSASGGATPHLDHSSFSATSLAVALEPLAARTLVTNSSVSGPGGFISLEPGHLPSGATRLASDLPYVVTGEDLLGAAGALTLAPGTIVKFRPGSGEPGALNVEGTLIAAASGLAPATLTSVYDDTVGGHCSCVSGSHPPAAGDWRGIKVYPTGSAFLENAAIRYPGTGLALTTGSTGQVTNSSFAAAGRAIEVEKGATLQLHGSTFEAGEEGLSATSGASVEATEDWWGATTGPRPAGTGAFVSPGVSTSPFCPNTACEQIALTVDREALLADGASQATASIALTRGQAARRGQAPTLSTSDPGETIGPIVETEPGIYTAAITASHALATATLTATDAGVSPAAVATTTLAQVQARKIKLKLKPATLTAGSPATTIATTTLTAGGVPVAGDRVALTTSDPGVSVGPATDHGDGTYTFPVAASTQIGTVNLTATDETVSPHSAATAKLKQKAPKIKLKLKPSTLPANGTATTTVTITVAAGNTRLPGQLLTIASSDPGQNLGPISDMGDGTYAVIITASHTVGSATITVTDASISPHPDATAALHQG